jgi:hypothetical protein
VSLRCFTFSHAPPEHISTLGALVWFASKPGVLQYMVHLERLKGLAFTRFDYVPMADDLNVEAVYKGYAFTVTMMWGGHLDLFATTDVPKDIFDEVCRHLKAYRRVGWIAVARASNRYGRMAKGRQ